MIILKISYKNLTLLEQFVHQLCMQKYFILINHAFIRYYFKIFDR